MVDLLKGASEVSTVETEAGGFHFHSRHVSHSSSYV